VLDFYEPEEVAALARAARSGAHRDPSRPAKSASERAERRLADGQDAALFVVAAFTGLRMGELLELRWRRVSFERATLTVAASWTGGQVTVPKSRKPRTIPLATPAAAELARLAERSRFVGTNADQAPKRDLSTHYRTPHAGPARPRGLDITPHLQRDKWRPLRLEKADLANAILSQLEQRRAARLRRVRQALTPIAAIAVADACDRDAGCVPVKTPTATAREEPPTGEAGARKQTRTQAKPGDRNPGT
jgi:Phage integrase family